MLPSRILFVRFSPTGRTRRLMRLLASAAAGRAPRVDEIDVTDRYDRDDVRVFNPEDLVFVGVPVYFGRVPRPMQSLPQWQGNGAVAIPVVTYGCRAHEDALRELAATLEASGFRVPAGAAFPVEHSQFPEFGAGRPNDGDGYAARTFVEEVLTRLETDRLDGKPAFPGEGDLRPYPPQAAVPVPDPVCRMCGRCTEACPMDIIDPFSMRVTDTAACIGCRACIDACPDGMRHFPEPFVARLAEVKARIAPVCTAAKSPEFFFHS